MKEFVNLIRQNPGLDGKSVTNFLSSLGYHRHEVAVAYVTLIDSGEIVVDSEQRFWPS